MRKEEIKILFDKYLQNRCSEEDLRLLLSYFNDDQNKEHLRSLLDSIMENEQVNNEEDFLLNMGNSFVKTDLFLSELTGRYESKITKAYITPLIIKYAVAAIVLLVGAYAIYQFRFNTEDHKKENIALSAKEFLRTTLVTDLGESIALHKNANYPVVLFEGAGVKIEQLSPDYIKLLVKDEDRVVEAVNSLKAFVAIGEKLNVELLDGSIIALNSASVMTFPLNFEQEKREVFINGEGYFDVATRPEQPFLVRSSNQVIKVYGTKFNVKNFIEDDIAITTLFEGKVSVMQAMEGRVDNEHVLKPGEQFLLSRLDQKVKYAELKNSDDILAWRSGKLVYENTLLKDIMKDLSRWYDMDIDLESLPNLTFSGTIYKDYELDKVLTLIMKSGNINLIRKGRTIEYKNN